MANSKPSRPLTIQDMEQALGATRNNLIWWAGRGKIPRATVDAHGRQTWELKDIQDWSATEEGRALIAKQVH
ncbi:MAG: hypothetical protein EXR45_00910 [Chloroflexi bacterium]|nr:hypothetical protein [Chloroflexota bacterium]